MVTQSNEYGRRFLVVSLVGAGIVGASSFGFGGKKPVVPAAVVPSPVSGEKVQVSALRFNVDLNIKDNRVFGLAKTGQLSFEQDVPGQEHKLTCDYPVSLAVTQGKRELDASLSKLWNSIHKRLRKSPLVDKYFQTTFFVKDEAGVKLLTEGKLQDVIGDYELVPLPELNKAHGPKVAPMNNNGIAFAPLDLSDDFRSKVKLRISPSESGDYKRNVLCQQIEQSGFTIKKL